MAADSIARWRSAGDCPFRRGRMWVWQPVLQPANLISSGPVVQRIGLQFPKLNMQVRFLPGLPLLRGHTQGSVPRGVAGMVLPPLRSLQQESTFLRPANSFARNNVLPTGHPCTVRILSVLPTRVLYQQLKAAVLGWQGTCISSLVDTNPLPRRLLMKKIQFALPVMALTAALCWASQPTLAQSASDPSRNPTTQQQPMQPDDQNPANAASEKTFSGKIVKSGGKLVITTADKTTYQIDDQQKAQDFLNKSVKVTGVLDAATGTIRVTAIDRALSPSALGTYMQGFS